MSELSESLERALQDVIAMKSGELPMRERNGMPALTYYIPNDDEKLIDKFIELRKENNISQAELAEKIKVKQQAISRTERKENSPSLKLFCEMINALGYEIQIVKC